MGICIRGYKGLEKIKCHFNEWNEPIDINTGEEFDFEVVAFNKNRHFPGRADGIDDNNVYRFKDNDEFVHLSYGGYNVLRNILAKVAGYKLLKYTSEITEKEKESYCMECWEGAKGPFSELINFSDCDGVIGSGVSKKLVHDFIAFQSAAEKTEDERFIRFYNNLKAAFEMSSDNGAVKFS